jgi:hypothetical protein
MVSGINSTLRQVGIAAGVAALGSILAARIRDSVASALAGSPLAHHAHQIAAAVSSGHVAQALAQVPSAARERLALASRTAFVHALNDVLLIAAIVAFPGAAVALTLIRTNHFIDASDDGTGEEPETAAGTPEIKLAASAPRQAPRMPGHRGATSRRRDWSRGRIACGTPPGALSRPPASRL